MGNRKMAIGYSLLALGWFFYLTELILSDIVSKIATREEAYYFELTERSFSNHGREVKEGIK